MWIKSKDIKAISKSPGIGTKSAQRIILELKDKISKDMISPSAKIETSAVSQAPSGGGRLTEATQALMVLGYDKNTILNALRGIDSSKLEVADIIKLALKKLSQR